MITEREQESDMSSSRRATFRPVPSGPITRMPAELFDSDGVVPSPYETGQEEGKQLSAERESRHLRISRAVEVEAFISQKDPFGVDDPLAQKPVRVPCLPREAVEDVVWQKVLTIDGFWASFENLNALYGACRVFPLCNVTAQ